MKLKIFFANFQIHGPLGCQGWVVIPQIVKKSQNHYTLLPIVGGGGSVMTHTAGSVTTQSIAFKYVMAPEPYRNT
jgi:hypothetical protein